MNMNYLLMLENKSGISETEKPTTTVSTTTVSAQTTQSLEKTGSTTDNAASLSTQTSTTTANIQQSTSGDRFLTPVFTNMLLAVGLSIVCGQIDLRF